MLNANRKLATAVNNCKTLALCFLSLALSCCTPVSISTNISFLYEKIGSHLMPHLTTQDRSLMTPSEATQNAATMLNSWPCCAPPTNAASTASVMWCRCALWSRQRARPVFVTSMRATPLTEYTKMYNRTIIGVTLVQHAIVNSWDELINTGRGRFFTSSVHLYICFFKVGHGRSQLLWCAEKKSMLTFAY